MDNDAVGLEKYPHTLYAPENPVLPGVRDRAMRSATFKILAQREGPLEEWEQGVLEEVIGDTVAIDRVRWFERAVWLFVALAVGTGAFMAGWYIKPVPEPEPIQWNCDVKVGTSDEVKCKGVQ